MGVKKDVPKTPPAIRAYLARRRISKQAVATVYGCSKQWISAVLCERGRATSDTIRRVREAILEVEKANAS